MKAKILIFLLAYCSVTSAKTYYVSTTGKNSNAGTLAAPYLTLSYAQDKLRAGDTLYLRGGIYNIDYDIGIDGTHDGTVDNPICFYAFPNETVILDAILQFQSNGMWVRDAEYWYFKGITIRNAKQDGSANDISGFKFSRCNEIRVDNCTSYGNGGPGFTVEQAKGIYYLTNCDSYANFDTDSDRPGNDADGFVFIGAYNQPDKTQWPVVYVNYCRAWDNSDDGYDIAYGVFIVMNGCWAIRNGYSDGDGRGVTVGLQAPATANKMIKITNCLSVYNSTQGFRINSNSSPNFPDGYWYNNTAAFNGQWDFRAQFNDPKKGGTLTFKNNIAYGKALEQDYINSSHYSMEPGLGDIHVFNTWDIAGLVISEADFLSIDSTGLTGPRTIEGNLPDLPFLKIAPGSRLIDAGTPVGLGYKGEAPDLGAFETGKLEAFITSPLDGAEFNKSVSITINAKTTVLDQYISKVEFFNGDNKLGETSIVPWSFTWNDVPLGDYCISVVAWDISNSKSTSPTVNFKVRSNTDLLYPNPNNGVFTLYLTYPLLRTAEVNIFSMEGKVIYRGTMQQEETIRLFEISHLKPGVYTLVLSQSEIILAMKFIRE